MHHEVPSAQGVLHSDILVYKPFPWSSHQSHFFLVDQAHNTHPDQRLDKVAETQWMDTQGTYHKDTPNLTAKEADYIFRKQRTTALELLASDTQ